jgi:hypothetical protein
MSFVKATGVPHNLIIIITFDVPNDDQHVGDAMKFLSLR